MPSSSLSRISISKRRQLAATLGLFAVLFVAVAAVAATGRSSGVLTAFMAVALTVAVLLALMGWGVANSVKIDLADQRLDRAIEDAVAARGGLSCDCGHDHDPTELHVTDDPCARDGDGHLCSHTCDTCVLATLRTTAGNAVVPPRPRPSPR